MVDDTMEISSDHGHNDEQGDIDIDLDLTAGPGDEDFILEDATSHVDFGDDFHPQTSTAVNDDIMVDDDNASYEMEDAELLDEETEHIIEQESMSFGAEGDGSYFDVNGQAGEQFLADDTNDISYEDYGTTNHEPLGFDLQEDPKVGLLVDTENTDGQHLKTTEAPTQGTLAQGSQASNSSRHSVPPNAPTKPRSPPTSVGEPGPTPPHITQDHTDLKSTHDSNDSLTSPSQIPSSLQLVVVVYREVEYALFSTSEDDDPDSYFLSDVTIAEKPLRDFFKAIRNVIREDLVDEDELCIVIDTLGLQAEEVSSVIEDVTLLQVLNLYAKLSENDGPESSGGCHIVLKTRTNFSRRFSNLVAGAAEGKGLSAYAYWDDQSIVLNDTEEPEEGKYDIVSVVEGQELGEGTQDHDEQQQYEHAESDGVDSELAPQENKQENLQVPGHEAQHDQYAITPEVTGPDDHSAVASPKSTAPKLSEKRRERDADVDEDGDLIDYSEDEDAVIEKREPASRHTDKDEAATEEFEQRDELLRRRSLDRRQSSSGVSPEEQEEELEETGLERQESNGAGQSNVSTEEGRHENEPDGQFVEKEEYTGGNELEYEQFDTEENEDLGENDYEHFNEDNLEYGDDRTERDGLASIAAQADLENGENNPLLEQYEVAGEYDGSELDHGFATVQSANHESSVANFDNNDDLEFDVGDVSFHDESKQENALLELDETNGTVSVQDASKPSILAVIETAESSVTMGADEIQYEDDTLEGSDTLVELDQSGALEDKSSPKTALVIEQKDEIDYEDDEGEAELPLQAPALVPEVQRSQNVNGKRSIADVESNDNQSLQTNDVKRPRS